MGERALETGKGRVPGKTQRHAEILRLVRSERIPSQERLRERLEELGFQVTQATLSRDLRALGVGKVADGEGRSHYAVPADVADPAPTLTSLLPALCTGVDAVGNLVVVRTLMGGAQPLAVAIDRQSWDEVVGTLAGDDTILMITRSNQNGTAIARRLSELADL